jgi:glycosyltransferase involved in cell wall biosynthesis
MNKQPLISVPIFTYNGEKFLEQQLESIYAQTYKNLEVIACDDASSDKTVNILKKYHNSYGLKYFVHEKNVGVSQNVAKAFSLCTGDFIAPSDQDDVWKPEKLQLLIDNIGDSSLIYSLSTPIDENDNPLDSSFYSREQYIEGHNNLGFLFENCVSGHTMMFKKELLPYLDTLPNTVYPDWWIAFVASSYGDISFFDEPLVYYRRHSSQLTQQSKKQTTTLLSRLHSKEKHKKSDIQKISKRLESFAGLSILDLETKRYISDLYIEFEKFNHLYYNKKLEELLQFKYELVFAMFATKASKYIKKLSKGIWYYRLRFYV